jgi:hypothetical protein
VSLLTLVMQEQVPVNCRRISQKFFCGGYHVTLLGARDVKGGVVSVVPVSGEDGRGESVNLAVRTLPLLISSVVSIVAPHPIHPFSFFFPSAERRQVQVVVRAD